MLIPLFQKDDYSEVDLTTSYMSKCLYQELERTQETSAASVAEEGEKGRNLRNAIHRRCKQLEEAFAQKELEMDKLQKKMRILSEEVCIVFFV